MRVKSTSPLLQWRTILFACSAIFLLNKVPAQNRSIAIKKLQQQFNADKRIEKVQINPELLSASLIKISATEAINPQNAVTVLKSMLGCREGIDDLKPSSSIDNKTGVNVVRLQQYYRNIKVAYANYTTVSSNGRVQAFSGDYYLLDNISVVPVVSEAAALQLAKNFVHAGEYAWEQADALRIRETDPAKKAKLDKLYHDLLPNPELVIVKDFSNNSGNPVFDLAYKYDIYASNPLSRGYVFVNAHTGKIMLYNKIIKHVNPDFHKNNTISGLIPEAAGIVSMPSASLQNNFSPPSSVATQLPTRYAGTRTVGTKQISGNDPNSGFPITSSTGDPTYIPGSPTYVLIDDGVGEGIETYDLNGVGGLPISAPGVYLQGKSFTDVDNNWTLAEHNRGGQNNEAENDDYVFDAHWGAKIVHDYWDSIHGRKSFDNLDSKISSFVHYGAAYDNAFWNGSVMTYGDGSFQGGLQAGFAPLTSLDVCGHEIGHGICSFTSDLVYQGESGAMNEGYSDIWASCIENYTLNRIDPSLVASAARPNGYKIWWIGEQIDANDATGTAPNMVNIPSNNPGATALRYMDDPNRAGDPGSYAEKTPVSGTRRWKDPNCTAPNLVNDECGVHTNSGVLNHLFYLLVSGGAGTTNTVNAENTTGALDGQPYLVTGVGFATAEKIMYLAEQMIPSGAKFIDTRNAAVLAAEILYGKCSFEWKQTILAWHAVAVGSSSDTAFCSTAPKFSVAILDSVTEATPKVMGNCTSASSKIDLSLSMLPPANANAVTVTITPGGTATLNRDYTIESLSVNYPANVAGLMKDSINIINDAEIEGNESIVLAIHATDGAGFTADTTVTIIISDDDYTPIISNNRVTLLNENFDATATGSLPAGWTSIDKAGNNVMGWSVGDGGGASAFTTKSVMADDNSIPGVAPTYPPASPANIILRTPLIDAAALNDIQLSFSWAAGGEPDPGPPVHPLDYGKVLYSLDGVNFQPFQFYDKEYAFSPSATKDSINIPAQLAGKKFYIGFQWQNDDNVAVPPSFHLDSIKITAGRQKVESKAGDGVSETQYSGKDIYYLSAQDGQVIARIRNNTEDLGCVTAMISQEGDGASNTAFNYNSMGYERAKKVVAITPSPGNATASYEASLYFTTAEVGTFNPAQSKLLKVKDGVALSGTIANSDAELAATVFEDHSTDGYYTFRGNFTGFSQFLLVQALGPLPVTITSFQAFPENNKHIKLTWTTESESNISSYVVERALPGTSTFIAIGSVTSNRGSASNLYSYIDADVKANITYQYRLRIVGDGRTTYSWIRSARITGKEIYVNIAPNPSSGLFRLSMGGYKGKVQMRVFNELNQLVLGTTASVADGVPVDINLYNQARGIYTLRIYGDNFVLTEKLVVQ